MHCREMYTFCSTQITRQSSVCDTRSTVPRYSAQSSLAANPHSLHTCDVEVANHKHGPPGMQQRVYPVVQHLPDVPA